MHFRFGSADEKFPKLIDAIIRSCDRQSNRCADFFNRKGQSKTQECNAQLTDCKKVATAQSGNAGPTLPADQNTQIQSGPITLSGQQTAQDVQLSQNTQTQTTQQIELTGQGSGDQNVQLDQNTQLQTGQTNQTAQVDQNTQLQTGQPDPNAQSVQLGQDTQISTDLGGPTLQTPPARPTDQSTRLADLAGPTIQTPPGRTTDQSTRVADLAGPTIQNLPGRTNDQTARLAGLPGSTTQNIRTSDKITVDTAKTALMERMGGTGGMERRD
ncbi:hypothetical protein PTTG_10564 [Puccinia triticina 1-1 BBBD Race 1]|uniref:Uncharacterized protein n=1 Tax=Puccinia triticina (isolate 1-1 / race 1 (BBBD)) TaxID=630390 RepID=A0A0C4FBG6_PUCT1|nr:hypothetical protein PTTG_10564 [Puccinia triticina 1-1 BBBD Race 1]